MFASGSQIELICRQQWGNHPAKRKRFHKNRLHAKKKTQKKSEPSVFQESSE